MPLKKNEPVIIVPYDPEWKLVFRSLKNVIGKKLGDNIISIEHIGSTSVEGLSSKPVIDLNIIIENYGILDVITCRLNELGYNYEGEKGIAGRFAYSRNDEYVPYDDERIWMDHHLYVCEKNNKEFQRQMLFRDYLSKNKTTAKEYEKLKYQLSEKYRNDRKKYTDSKTEFIEKILLLASKNKKICFQTISLNLPVN